MVKTKLAEQHAAMCAGAQIGLDRGNLLTHLGLEINACGAEGGLEHMRIDYNESRYYHRRMQYEAEAERLAYDQ